MEEHLVRKVCELANNNETGKVYYVREGSCIYFCYWSGNIDRLIRYEVVVKEISKQECINWKEFTWFVADRPSEKSYSFKFLLQFAFFSSEPSVSSLRSSVIPTEIYKLLTTEE